MRQLWYNLPMLKLPYAIRNFYALITEGYLYLDRTDRISIMENLGKELLFLRPRRFGKSLWLSTLMNYYDVAKADDFERLFGHLAVGQNPTPLHNQYLVMKWDFSAVRSHGTIEQIEENLHTRINVWISIFANNYRDLLPETIPINSDALASFDAALAVVNQSPYKLYLFIDEYDNFANEVMMGRQGQNQKRYQDLVSGEGMFKTLFKNVKIAGSGNGLDRVFMTGVSPIVMNDITNGANVNEDVTWLPYFNDLCGFRQEEVRTLTEQVISENGLSEDKRAEALEQMRIFYNGSRFVIQPPHHNGSEVEKVYNPILVFYFLRNIQRFGVYPRNMLDNNLAPDYNKLVYISSHAKGEQLLLDALNDETSITVTDLDDRFGMHEMLDLDKQRERLAALLCYLGALTIAGVTPSAKIRLEVPNLVMRKLYAERILNLTFKTADERDQVQEAADRLFGYGEIELLCTFLEKHLLKIYDNRDYQQFNELTLKTLFIALLHHNNVYIMDSEPALERRYADLIMIVRPEMRHYVLYDILLEFKVVPLNKLIVGKKQLTGQDVTHKSRAELLELEAVKQALDEAKSQLHSYHQSLQAKYGQALKLRSYAVLAVSFERLIWEEVSSPILK